MKAFAVGWMREVWGWDRTRKTLKCQDCRADAVPEKRLCTAQKAAALRAQTRGENDRDVEGGSALQDESFYQLLFFFRQKKETCSGEGQGGAGLPKQNLFLNVPRPVEWQQGLKPPGLTPRDQVRTARPTQVGQAGPHTACTQAGPGHGATRVSVNLHKTLARWVLGPILQIRGQISQAAQLTDGGKPKGRPEANMCSSHGPPFHCP